MKRTIFIFGMALIMIAMLSGSATALTCDYEEEPLVSFDFTIPLVPDRWQVAESNIYWHCVSNMTNYDCVSAIHDGITPLHPILQVNPDAEDLAFIGRIDTFESDGRVVNPYFRVESNIIRHNISYLFGVHCSNGTTNEDFAKVVTPQYREAEIPVTFFTVQMQFISYIILSLFVIALLIFLIKWYWGTVKDA